MKPLTPRDEEVLAVSKILNLRKARALLALWVLFQNHESDPIYKCYILGKISAVLELDEPETILNPNNLKMFKKMFGKFLEEDKQW